MRRLSFSPKFFLISFLFAITLTSGSLLFYMEEIYPSETLKTNMKKLTQNNPSKRILWGIDDYLEGLKPFSKEEYEKEQRQDSIRVERLQVRINKLKSSFRYKIEPYYFLILGVFVISSVSFSVISFIHLRKLLTRLINKFNTISLTTKKVLAASISSIGLGIAVTNIMMIRNPSSSYRNLYEPINIYLTGLGVIVFMMGLFFWNNLKSGKE